MVDGMPAPVPPRSGIRRSRSGAVLGGVCAGVARSAGLDPLLLRVAVVAVTVLTGGAGLLAYLAAWVLIPREDAPLPGTALSAGGPLDVRSAWSTAGKDLKSLAGELRRPPSAVEGTPTSPGTTAPAEPPSTPIGVSTGTGMPESGDTPPDTAPVGPPPGGVPAQRSPLEAADDAATALGERLRAPEVQAGARRAAASVSQALAASVDEVGKRVRRDRGRDDRNGNDGSENDGSENARGDDGPQR
jgi:phage shock protein PspC (stress-responsive transcriptional regulator)